MTWELTDHICALCLGRVLTNDKTHRCSNCGRQTEGQHTDLCCCGITLRNGRDALIRCVRNDEPSPSMPCEVVAAQTA